MRLHARARLFTTSLSLTALLILGSCAAPNLEGAGARGYHQSTCEASYAQASAMSGRLTDAGIPMMMRYLSATDTPEFWTSVAMHCAQRFAEGSLRSAQTQYRLATLGHALGVGDISQPLAYLTSVNLTALSPTVDDPDIYASMSLAEDRAGFAMEILAARSAGKTALRISDAHKTTAEQLFKASRADQDPRQKVYAVSTLIANPDTIRDRTTGMVLPTTAVVEIDCAREELTAMPLPLTDDTEGAAASESAASQGADAARSGTTKDGESSSASSSAQKNLDLRALSQLVSSRAYTAFSYGYPHFDAALFK